MGAWAAGAALLGTIGALLAGLIADAVSIGAAIWAVAVLTALSGLVVIVRMYETNPPGRVMMNDDSEPGGTR